MESRRPRISVSVFLAAVVLTVALIGIASAVFFSQPVAPSTSTLPGFQPQLDTLPGGNAQLSMLSSNFQVNGTGGSLFVVFKDYTDTPAVVSSIAFDGAVVSNSSGAMSGTCETVQAGSECQATLVFGDGGLPLPAVESSHTLTVALSTGASLAFQVTAGELEEAACTFTSSC